jgi:hypothetical protein
MTLCAAFEDQAVSCERLALPFMGHLLRILSENWQSDAKLGKAMAAYTGDVGPFGHSLPLRIAGGLHALVLTGQSDALIAAYPPNTSDHSALEIAVSHALVAHENFMLEWTQSPLTKQ